MGCSCKWIKPLDTLRTISYKSDIVFLGELIKTDTANNSYAFKILELFKGNYKDSVIFGQYFDSCSLLPLDTGKWIVYADIEDNFQINISDCLGSRSEKNPWCTNCYELPLPDNHPKSKKYALSFQKSMAELKKQAIKDWNEELIILKNLRMK